jgi:hypothetical protein
MHNIDGRNTAETGVSPGPAPVFDRRGWLRF